MPENIRRAMSRGNENRVPPLPGQTFDLMSLTEQEEIIIQAVLQKDDLEMRILETKISELRKEIQEIRKAGALTDDDNQDEICARCKSKFPPFILPWSDNGQRCIVCKFRMCSSCCTKQTNGSRLCILCSKYRQEKLLTGEWMMSQEQSTGPHGSELLKALLRDRRRVQPACDEPKCASYTQRPAKNKDADSESRTSKNSQSSSEITELRKEKLSQHRTPSVTSSVNLQNFQAIDISAHEMRDNSRFCIKSPNTRITGVDNNTDFELCDRIVTANSPYKMRAKSTSSATDSNSTSDISYTVPVRTKKCSVSRSHCRVKTNASSDDHGIKKHHFGQPVQDSPATLHSNIPYTCHLNSPPEYPLSSDYSGMTCRLDRRRSISEHTLHHDDVRLLNFHVTRMSSRERSSKSSLSSGFGMNPKYRSLKPASGTSELEIFRKTGQRYSMRRKKAQPDDTNEAKGVLDIKTVYGNNVNSKERKLSVYIKNSWIPHWHETLRRRSLVEMVRKQNKCRKTASTPVLNVMPPDESLFALVKPRFTKPSVLKDSNSNFPNNPKHESILSEHYVSINAETTKVIQKKMYSDAQSQKARHSSTPELFSLNMQVLPVEASIAAKIMTPTSDLYEILSEPLKEGYCCSPVSIQKRLDSTIFKFQGPPIFTPNVVDSEVFKFQISPTFSSKLVDSQASKYQIPPASTSKHMDSPNSTFQITHTSPSKLVDTSASKFRIPPVSSPKLFNSPASIFPVSSVSTFKRNISSTEGQKIRYAGESKVMRSRSDVSSTSLRRQTLRRSGFKDSRRRSLSQGQGSQISR